MNHFPFFPHSFAGNSIYKTRIAPAGTATVIAKEPTTIWITAIHTPNKSIAMLSHLSLAPCSSPTISIVRPHAILCMPTVASLMQSIGGEAPLLTHSQHTAPTQFRNRQTSTPKYNTHKHRIYIYKYMYVWEKIALDRNVAAVAVPAQNSTATSRLIYL